MRTPLFFKRTLLFFSIVLLTFQGFSQTKIKAMMYNLLNYSDASISQQKTPFFRTILDEVNPDLIMVCELINLTGSDYLFNNAILTHNQDFDKATFEINQSSGSNLQQMVYFNTKKLVLETSRVIQADTRDINHYTFRLNTENSATNPMKIEVFVSHLKASTGSSNRQRRLTSIEDFIASLNDIPNDSHVIFAGDFNFYTSNEEGYERLINPANPIVMIDPINRPADPFPNDPGVSDPFSFYNSSSSFFWRNSSFEDIHTQSTRASNTGLIDQSGSTGGLDDRFDFIMLSENFTTSSNLYYVNGSYESVGNNGNCYDNTLSDPTCSGPYSQSLRTALTEFSDHIPVVLEIETPENTLSTTTFSQNILILKNNLIETTLHFNVQPNSTIEILRIFNTQGQLIKTIDLRNEINESFQIDVQHLSKGIYYISAQNLTKPIKFVKI